MRKVLLSTVAALSVVGFAGVASAQSVPEGTIPTFNTDGGAIGDPAGDVVRVEDILAVIPDSAEECTVCTRFDTVDEIADKAMNKGYDYVNVQFRNDAFGDMTVTDSNSGIVDNTDLGSARDLNISTQAMAGVQANLWEVSNSGLGDVEFGGVPNTGLNVQYANFATANMTAPDGLAEDVKVDRDVNISTSALAGVQANIVRAGNLALTEK
jgi:post-segregation antitoxin (ccd killing protein)